MVDRQINIGLAGRVGFEIDGQIAVLQRWMTCYIFNVVACHGVDGIDAMFRLVYPITLGLIAGHRISCDPIQGFELESGCRAGKGGCKHGDLL